MKSNIVAACILAVGLIVSGFLLGGRYSFVNVGTCAVVEGDRLLGGVRVIRNDYAPNCKTVSEAAFDF